MILIVLDIILIILLVGILFYGCVTENYKTLHQIGRGADMRLTTDVLKRPSRDDDDDALSLKYGRREPRYARTHRRFHHLNRQNVRQLTNP